MENLDQHDIALINALQEMVINAKTEEEAHEVAMTMMWMLQETMTYSASAATRIIFQSLNSESDDEEAPETFH